MFRLRLTALVAILAFLVASPAFAQSFKPKAPEKQTSVKKIDFSADAAGLRAPAERATAKSSIPFNPPQNKKPIMKRPLTWALIAAAVAVLVLAMNDDGYDY